MAGLFFEDDEGKKTPVEVGDAPAVASQSTGAKEVATTAPAADPPAATAATADDVAALKAQVASMQVALQASNDLLTRQAAERETERETNRVSAIGTAAQTFATAELNAGRCLPTDVPGMVTDYTLAAEDDHARPLKDGSRVARLTERQAKVKPHGLTTERTVGTTTQRPENLTTLMNGEHTDAGDVSKQKSEIHARMKARVNGEKIKVEN